MIGCKVCGSKNIISYQGVTECLNCGNLEYS